MEIDISDKKIMNRMGFPFWNWAIYGHITIIQQDLEYLDFIKAHPCFPIISANHRITEPKLSWANARINEIVFYEHFYNDLSCPSGIKNILFAIIGIAKGNLTEKNLLSLLSYRYHSVELWLNSVK